MALNFNRLISAFQEAYITDVVGLGSQEKGRAHTGDIGIGRKPKHESV
jgi:hypothetical protein